MREVRFSADWTFRGFQALVLENQAMRVVVLPQLGGKIWSIVLKARDREMLWHNPRVPPRPAHVGAGYDDWFSGGWDELFPNDAPVTIDGEPYPDHGEVWSLAAEWTVVERRADVVTIVLTNRGVVTPTRFEKAITLHAGEPMVRVAYRITNEGPVAIDYLWKIHPALALGAEPRIDLPARRVVVDPAFAAGFSGEEFVWPMAPRANGTVRDMRQVPPATAQLVDFYYGVELDAGWAAITQVDERIGFGLAFDPEVLRTVWLFGTYGGWRGLHTAILEPCTGYPYRLDQAIAQGTCAHLAPGQDLETEVVAVIYEGLGSVEAISRDGQVTGT